MALNIIDQSPEGVEPKLLEEAAKAAFEYLSDDFEVNLKYVTEAEIRQLNKTYREKDAVTDVLSFNVELERSDGDIAVYFEELKKDADEWSLEISEMAAFLLVHGMLHLAGYDHTNDEDRDRMEKAEGEILAKIGVKIG